ncbi:hypothetical protein GGX14DRAFT_419792 [Mycena pura]|uniref:Uncharacterized protein n=1 Tax=Mycena pura TaxID=153505 RepID=A0AAD6YS97_9AGAR|nr:hypothetical protein GGX14DRAFT_419792 [Mycena pura]
MAASRTFLAALGAHPALTLFVGTVTALPLSIWGINVHHAIFTTLPTRLDVIHERTNIMERLNEVKDQIDGRLNCIEGELKTLTVGTNKLLQVLKEGKEKEEN